ncbi:hypothetical protein SFUMM280S_03332 [Streptomyces fumanus]
MTPHRPTEPVEAGDHSVTCSNRGFAMIHTDPEPDDRGVGAGGRAAAHTAELPRFDLGHHVIPVLQGVPRDHP